VRKKDRQEWREKHAEWAVEKDLHWFGELFYSMVPGELEREVEAWKLQLVIGRSRLTFLPCSCLLRSVECVETQYCGYLASNSKKCNSRIVIRGKVQWTKAASFRGYQSLIADDKDSLLLLQFIVCQATQFVTSFKITLELQGCLLALRQDAD
jgi:hypothetical protein